MSRETPLGLPEKLSPSRAKDFLQCPRLFYYKTILGIATPPTAATIKGTLCHHVFERIFDHPREERTLPLALDYVDAAWAMMLNPLPGREQVPAGTLEHRIREATSSWAEEHDAQSRQGQRLLADAAAIAEILPREEQQAELLEAARVAVTGWFSMENPAKFDPLHRELYVSARVAGCQVHGFIDRLDRTDHPDGDRYWITDYKTGKPPGARFQDEAFFQLAVYAVLVKEQIGVTPHRMRLVYVREGRRDAVLTRDVDEALLRRTRAKLTATWESITRAARSDTWTPRKQVLCDWCHFKDVCPAWNPALEGLLPEEVEHRLRQTRP